MAVNWWSLYLKNASNIISFSSESGLSSEKEASLSYFHTLFVSLWKAIKECYQSSVCVCV